MWFSKFLSAYSFQKLELPVQDTVPLSSCWITSKECSRSGCTSWARHTPWTKHSIDAWNIMECCTMQCRVVHNSGPGQWPVAKFVWTPHLMTHDFLWFVQGHEPSGHRRSTNPPREKRKALHDFASRYLCKRDFRWISKDGTRSLLAQAVEDLTGPI